MMERISILCPTRQRLSGMDRLVRSALTTASHPGNVDFVFYIDNDDLDSKFKASDLGDEFEERIYFVSGERIVLSEMWNQCFRVAKGNILMHGADDIEFKTQGWDEIVRQSFAQYEDRIAFVYGNDGIHPLLENSSPAGCLSSFGTHGFQHRKAVEVLGYFVPPYFSSDYNDTWLNDIYWLIGRKVPVCIETEHHHFSAGKAEIDQNTKDRLERHIKDNPQQIYNEKGPERIADAAKLQRFIENYNHGK